MRPETLRWRNGRLWSLPLKAFVRAPALWSPEARKLIPVRAVTSRVHGHKPWSQLPTLDTNRPTDGAARVA